MTQWVPFEKGIYQIQEGLVISRDNQGVTLDDAFIEVFQDLSGIRNVKGRGFVQNALVVELLETNDVLDVVLNLGDGFFFRLEDPDIVAGKVFSPGVKSVLQFFPKQPWQAESESEFNGRLSRLRWL